MTEARLERKIVREKAAREEAERLLEQKSLEFYTLNQQLQHVLDHSPLGVLILQNNVVIQSNSHMHRLFNQNMRNSDVSECLEALGFRQDDIAKLTHQLVEEPEQNSFLFNTADRYFEFNVVPLLLMREPLRFVIYINEYTELKQITLEKEELAFKAGLNEKNISLLHNIGNALAPLSSKIHGCNRLVNEFDYYLSQIQIAQEKLTQLQDDSKALSLYSRLCNDLIEQFKQKVMPTFEANHEFIHQQIQVIEQSVKTNQDAQTQPQAERFDLSELLEHAVSNAETLDPNHWIEFQRQLTPFIEVELPKHTLLQSLINLLKNSVEALLNSPGTNQALIRVCLELSNDRPKCDIKIVIEDNGIGISPEILPNIFNYQFSTKNRGSGFGLHSVANVIQSMNGSIEAESNGIHQGAKFTIYLPKTLKS